MTLIFRFAFVLSLALPMAALAQTWPDKPIRIVVPFPPGGTTDLMGRLIASKLSELLGQPVVIENKAGANGNIASEFVARSAPDGNTLIVTGVGTHGINQSLYKKLPFDVVRDFTHVGIIAKGPNTLVVTPTFQAQTLEELIAMAKAKPGALNYASTGSGASNHLSMEMLKARAGIFITHIPYKGGAPAITDVMAGQLPMMFINYDLALPYVKAGRLRALAVTSPKRTAQLPDVPTVAESGFPDFAAESWTGIGGPANLPRDVTTRINAEMQKALAMKDVKERLTGFGLDPVFGTPEDATTYVKAEVAKWAPVVKTSGAGVD